MKSTIEYEKIRNTLSLARLSTYENKYSDDDKLEALKLYQWNSEVSGAFLPCLQICEVVIRNSIAEVLAKVHGDNWAWNQGFKRTLKKHHRENLEKIGNKFNKIDKVIPELNFVFWQSMLTSRNDKSLWKPHLRDVFTNIEQDKSIEDLRESLYNNIEEIRLLRNRIAHHEPIFDKDLLKIYLIITEIVKYRCDITCTWLETNQTVLEKIEKKPIPQKNH